MSNTSKLSADFLSCLADIVGVADLLTDPADRWPYSYDNSRRQIQPDAVVFPANHDEVRDCVRLCNQYKIPLLARGLGSSTTGSAVPAAGGLVLALERMQRVLRLSPEDRLMVVEAGITNTAAQEAAGTCGFFWGPAPTSAAYSTVGGNLACNAGGPSSVKYGTPRDNVLGLHIVTGAGEELRTGVYTSKGVMGYDLTRLVIGSEGTLAVITEATLKLTPKPETVRTLRAVYADMTAAAAAVSRIMAQPVTPCALEFIDHASIEIIRDYAQTDLPHNAGAMLLIEVDGLASQIESSVTAVEAAIRGDGLVELRAAHDQQEIEALWAARKALSPALRKITPKKINEDIAVPVSHMAEFISRLQEISKSYGITNVNFGHAGNGNIHVNLLVDPDDKQRMQAAGPCLQEIFQLVLSLDGTLSGEHGVGLEKRPYMSLEFNQIQLDIMRRIKQQFDPNGILNPGKLLLD
ncbi:MAG TPA: FAD-linked oxidase C-terminal domain-containing protein [Gammaproteobacteria bacterium]|nr:FAD-linked oxidase C-terminal domain-containing protein [Gammaproteobacteria bacterium]